MLADQPTPSAAQTFGKGTVEAYLLWKNIADLATDIRALKRQFERDYPEIEELPEPPTINIEGSLTRTKFKQATGWQAKLSRFWQPQAKNNPDNIWQVMLSELKAYEDYIMIVIRKANRIERHKETETIQDARKLLTLVNKVNKQIINIKSTPVLSFNYSQDLEARTWNRISDAERTALEDTRLILEKYKQLYQEIMKSKIQWWDVSWKLPFTADSYIQQIIQDYLTSDKPLADIYDASLDTITKKLSKASEKLAATEDKSNLPQQVKNYKILLDQYIQNVKDLPRLTAPTSNASLDWRDSWIDRLRASRLSDPFSLFASSPQIYVVGSLAYAIYRHYFQ